MIAVFILFLFFLLQVFADAPPTTTVAETTTPPIPCTWNSFAGECIDGDACSEQGRLSSKFSSACSSVEDGVCCIKPEAITCMSSDGKQGSCTLYKTCLDAQGYVSSTCPGLPGDIMCCVEATLVGLGVGFRLPDPTLPLKSASVVDDNDWLSEVTLNIPPPSTTAAPAAATTVKVTTKVTAAPTTKPAPISPGPAVSLVTPPTRNCNIVQPVCSHMRNVCTTPARVDREFMPFMAAYNACARRFNTRIQICSTYRSLSKNRQVGGATSSNHLVGHGIDMYLLDQNGAACTEACLLSVSRRNARPGVRDTLACFDAVRNSAAGFNPRWNIMIRGHLDVVHLDDRINVKYPAQHVAKRTACDADNRRPIETVECASFESGASFLRDENDYSGAESETPTDDPALSMMLSSSQQMNSGQDTSAAIIAIAVVAAIIVIAAVVFVGVCLVYRKKMSLDSSSSKKQSSIHVKNDVASIY